MKTGIAAGIALAGVLVSGGVIADPRPEVGLLAQCNELMMFTESKDPDAKVTMAMGLCVGTVDGVLKTMKALNEKLPKPFQTCFPEREVAITEAIREVVKYIRDSELTETDDATLAMFAIQDTYPCKA